MARSGPKPGPGGTQPAAPLQQLRPFDADRDAGGGQHPAGLQARHLGRQRRERLPRRGRGGGAAVSRCARDAGDGAAARVRVRREALRLTVLTRVAAATGAIALALPGVALGAAPGANPFGPVPQAQATTPTTPAPTGASPG